MDIIDHILDSHPDLPINEVDEENGLHYIDFISPESYKEFKSFADKNDIYYNKRSYIGYHSARLYFDTKEDLVDLLTLIVAEQHSKGEPL